MTKTLLKKQSFLSTNNALKPRFKSESIIDNHQVESHGEMRGDIEEANLIDASVPSMSLLSQRSMIEESGIQEEISILQGSGTTRESSWIESLNPVTGSQLTIQDQSVSGAIGQTTEIPGFKTGIRVTGSSVGIRSVDPLTGSATGSNDDHDQQLRDAVAQGKGMAADGIDDSVDEVADAVINTTIAAGVATGNPLVSGAGIAAKAGWSVGKLLRDTVNDWLEDDDNEPEDTSDRPGVDDNGGGGGTLDARGRRKLSEGLNKDPIINPNDEDLGVDYLSDTQLKQMESDLRNAKDPAVNWGKEQYNNFGGTVVMDRMAVSLKGTVTNWGDDYTSTDEVIETLITAPDVF